jgi:threonine dehydrogenase-like Zn-dependent dehydrogenase
VRSLWGKAPFQFEMRDLPEPEPGPDEVVVRVTACGICGTDLHFLGHNEPWTPLGHEVAGVIHAVGSRVTRWQGGEAVAVENHVGCGVCRQCKNGRALYCENLTTYMEDRAGFAEYLRVRADMVHAYDAAALAPHEASLAEPLGVALDLVQRADPDLNDEVAVFGPGPIGLMTVGVARLRGARRVVLTGSNRATERGRFRLELGCRMGADITLAAAEDDIVASILDAVPAGVDRVLVTAPPSTLNEAFAVSCFGGIVGLIGIEFGEGANLTFDVNDFHFKKLQLRASHAIPNHYFPIALDLLARRAIDPDVIISHVLPLDDYAQAIDLLRDPNQAVSKVVLKP